MTPEIRDIIARGTLIILLLVGIAMLLAQMASVLLLIFAAVLIAVLIRSVADPIRRLGIPDAVAVLLAVAAIFGLLGLVGWLFGAQLGSEFAEVGARLPGAIEAARGWASGLPFGNPFAGGLPDLQGLAGRAMSFAFGAVGAITNLVLVLIGAIYLALDPKSYARGIARLFPKEDGARVDRTLNASGVALRGYLLGQLATMAFVGTLVYIGLWFVGVPAAAALGLILALCNFVPLIGPFIGAIPGLLLALAQGPDVLLPAAIVYLVAQQLEGNVLTPLVQKQAVSIPPALLLFALAALGVLFGIVGVIVAAPLAVVLYMLVTLLWTKETLGHDVTVPGERPSE